MHHCRGEDQRRLVADETIGEIVRSYLKDHGFEGLYNDDNECGCGLEDLVPCGEDFSRCKPGFKSVCDCGNDYFHAVPTKCWICDECSAEKKAAGGDPTAALGHADPRITQRYLDPRITNPQQPCDLLPPEPHHAAVPRLWITNPQQPCDLLPPESEP